jgi:spermidine/putrescine transport system substrate-binding protein
MPHRRDREDRPPFGTRLSRREFLRRSAGGALAFSSASAILAACGKAPPAQGPSGSAGPSAFPLARPDRPVKWPVAADNKPIASNLSPEKGATLKLYNWDAYISHGVTDSFAEEFKCKVEVSTFGGTDEALAKLRTGQADFDVYFPDPSLLGKLVVSKLIQPLNLDYIPNLKNVWHQLQDPYYDRGSIYTVPYTIYTTGIGWREDHVPEDIPAMPNPYEILWDTKYAGKIHLLDDYRETLSMSLLKNGITDINTDDPQKIEVAKNDLIKLGRAVNPKLDVNDYTDLPEGSAFIHQSWSGDLVSAQYYLPKGTKVDVLAYWFPPEGVGVVGSDNMVVLRSAKNPVLAHHFLNFMLESEIAFRNFANFTGYQPPQNDINPDRLVNEGVVPANLKTTVVRPEDFDRGDQILELGPEADTLWHDAFEQFTAGG